MCGITGYIGKEKALPIVLDMLKTLEYRGYDSSGIAYKTNKINIIKKTGKISVLERNINKKENTCLCIGHTRWATHGKPNTVNAHPHKVGKITLVHNGIIENYTSLKAELINNNYSFKSETDTEVACAYIDYLYNKTEDMLTTLGMINKIFKGSYAFALIIDDDDKIYFAKNGSPLIIGLKNDEYYLASDVPAFLKYTNKYIILDDNEYGYISKKELKIYNQDILLNKEVHTFDNVSFTSLKDGYEHYMLKEIHEESSLVHSLASSYLTDQKTLLTKTPDLSKYNKIYIVGCGSAYHAGMIGKYLIQNNLNIEVQAYLGSEYRYDKLFLDKKTLVIFISQSGETADTLASLKITKEKNIDTLSIVNTYKSSIARLSKEVMYINAGPEIAVATTKAYTLQVVMLSIIVLAQKVRNNEIKYTRELLEMYKNLSNIIEDLSNKNYQSISNILAKKDDIFFIGRAIDYALCLEGSLKLKEISYIHSEAYPAGELKHGTISLIEKGTPVIAIITDKNIYDKTISNIKEVQARGAYIILIISRKLNSNDIECNKKVIINEDNDLLSSIASIIPLQLIAYNVAKKKKCSIDKPRNLAKSVTVE